MKYRPFPCDRCGLCCEHLSGIELYQDLDDGTGVCMYFDKKSRLCKIYDRRPEKCNINLGYELFQKQMTYEEYYQANIQGCQKLKEEYICHYHLSSVDLPQ